MKQQFNTAINLNNISLHRVENYKKEPFTNLQQLYEFEFSPITGEKINTRGLYDRESIKEHWSKNGVDIYIIHYKTLPIGFAVINLSSMLDGNINTRDIAEFFVMPNYRNQGVGEYVACKIFNFYQGKWEVRQLPGLDKAKSFWRKTIKKYTNDNFQDLEISNEQWKGTMQIFIKGGATS